MAALQESVIRQVRRPRRSVLCDYLARWDGNVCLFRILPYRHSFGLTTNPSLFSGAFELEVKPSGGGSELIGSSVLSVSSGCGTGKQGDG